ncbi:MAG: RNA polymerase subunit sigma-70 [Acidobacteria bacterium]|nr:MAG: RNA polymerase subunit sigma-70 [Acidobacteriota bacterium]
MASNPDKIEEISKILLEWGGVGDAPEELIPLVYEELRWQASSYLRNERQGHTLQTTALIHETYLKLVGQRNVAWQNRAHFFGVAAQAMKRILIDHAKTRHRAKRGGVAEDLPLEAATFVPEKSDGVDLEALDQGLSRLEKLDERQARIVDLKFFAGFTIDEISETLRLSPASVKREWNSAKAFLYSELTR